MNPFVSNHHDVYSIDNPKICCRLMRITTAAVCVAVAEIVLETIVAVFASLFLKTNNFDYAYLEIMGLFIIVLFTSVFAALLVYGIRKDRPFYFTPHMVLQLVTIACGVAGLIASAVTFMLAYAKNLTKALTPG